MTEEFLHYVWKFKLFRKQELVTPEGFEIEIINQGFHNTDAGPDFFNAKIKINETVWVGNIEIHMRASDWDKHGHQYDKAYNNVVLQLVCENDKEVKNQNGKLVTTSILSFEQEFYQKYQNLSSKKQAVKCAGEIEKVDDFYFRSFLERLMIERLDGKTQYMQRLLNQNNNNVAETFYQLLARNFGFKLNSLPFEMLAKSLPMIVVGKHKSSLTQIEAMLFGQSGLLELAENKDDYVKKLRAEYSFLRNKFGLQPIDGYLWKFLRLRPVNFPTIRIAQFAALVYQSSGLFSKVLNSTKLEDMWALYDVHASEYWNTHYTFGKESKLMKKKLGRSAFENIILNTVIPFLFVYGKNTGNVQVQERVFNWLFEVKPENNKTTRTWKDAGVKITDAFSSQALLQLTNNYCEKDACLSCAIGNKIITQKNGHAKL